MNKPRIDQGPDYERGFIDGMQHQMQSSVDKAVNRMAQHTWVGLTPEEVEAAIVESNLLDDYPQDFVAIIEAKLKEKNT